MQFPIKGEPSCAAIYCTALWSPESQEQRYCWKCHCWYHFKCLKRSNSKEQSAYLVNLVEQPEYRDIPKTILRAAFQPTARGGPNHFATGNIRIVHKARSLLINEKRVEVEKSNWMAAHLAEHNRSDVNDADWCGWLEYKFGIAEASEEQLVVEGQWYHSCPNCRSISLV